MSHRIASLSVFVVVVAMVAASGCFFGGPSRVHPPGISASAAGSGAMDQYDTDKDGVVKGPELDKAPSLKAAIKQLDTNHDGGVSADEVSDRVAAWQKSKVGLMSLACTVKMNKKPLSGATVTFEPEKFLGTNVKPATGKTDKNGIANVTIQVAQGEPNGVACGLYLVRISKEEGGKETVPARYNTQTTLGKEVALDAEGMQEAMIQFDLTSP
jgi:hypothetical protein